MSKYDIHKHGKPPEDEPIDRGVRAIKECQAMIVARTRQGPLSTLDAEGAAGPTATGTPGEAGGRGQGGREGELIHCDNCRFWLRPDEAGGFGICNVAQHLFSVDDADLETKAEFGCVQAAEAKVRQVTIGQFTGQVPR